MAQPSKCDDWDQVRQRCHAEYTGETTNLEQETSAHDTCLGFVIIGAGVILVLLCVGLSFVGALALFGLQIQIVPTQPTPTPLEQVWLLWWGCLHPAINGQWSTIHAELIEEQ